MALDASDVTGAEEDHRGHHVTDGCGVDCGWWGGNARGNGET